MGLDGAKRIGLQTVRLSAIKRGKKSRDDSRLSRLDSLRYDWVGYSSRGETGGSTWVARRAAIAAAVARTRAAGCFRISLGHKR